MSDPSSSLQLSNRPITDQNPFLILPGTDCQLSHAHNSLIGPPSQYVHLHSHQSSRLDQFPPHTDPLQFRLPQPPNQDLNLNPSLQDLQDTFDRALQRTTTQGLGLLPMPVAYEDFQYSFPNLDLPTSIGGAIDSGGLGPSCHQGSSSTRYPAYADQPGGAYASSRSIDSDWALSSSPVRGQFGSAAIHELVVPNPVRDQVQQDPSSSTPLLPMQPPPPLHSTPPPQDQPPPLHHLAYGHPPALFPHQPIYHASKPPTPPPLFDASEQDLLSSFLNIFGDANGECDFEPQGMPEGMPVLGALKRHLEASGPYAAEPASWQEKHEADDMGSAVERRLWISGPDSAPSHLRRPSLQSPVDALPGAPDPPRDQPVASRKKAKTGSYSGSHAEALAQPPTRPQEAHSEDVEMGHGPTDRAGGPSKAAFLREPTLSEFAAAASQKEREVPAAQGVPQPSEAHEVGRSSVVGRAGTGQAGQTLAEEAPTGEPGRERKPVAKGAKSTHLVSEQRRRNAIQGGFGSLVEILRAGEAESGISIANSGTVDGGGRDGKTTRARGRGRRGEIETGASKSVVLERAAWFVKWMERGNEALRGEVEGAEKRLEEIGWQVR